nr:MAG TPA: hypothetical protein [Caudoviricetes sp.]
MRTSKQQTSQSTGIRLQYCREGFPANPSQFRAKEKERMTTATSGLKCVERYERYDPLGLLVRMLMVLPVWYSPHKRLEWRVKPQMAKRIEFRSSLSSASAKNSKKKDIPSSRSLFRLVALVRHTSETGCGFLPTVQTQGLKRCNRQGQTEYYPLSLLPTPSATDGRRGGQIVDGKRKTRQSGQVYSANLNDLCKSGLLPTPLAIDASLGQIIGKEDNFWMTASGLPRKINRNGVDGSVGLARLVALMGDLPTPKTTDSRHALRERGKCNLGERMSELSFQATGTTSQLSPLFVAEMMGFPPDWTLSPFLAGAGNL